MSIFSYILYGFLFIVKCFRLPLHTICYWTTGSVLLVAILELSSKKLWCVCLLLQIHTHLRWTANLADCLSVNCLRNITDLLLFFFLYLSIKLGFYRSYLVLLLLGIWFQQYASKWCCCCFSCWTPPSRVYGVSRNGCKTTVPCWEEMGSWTSG